MVGHIIKLYNENQNSNTIKSSRCQADEMTHLHDSVNHTPRQNRDIM